MVDTGSVGGVQNIGRPIGDYNIIDEGKKLNKASPIDSKNSFDKALRDVRSKEVEKASKARGFVPESSRTNKDRGFIPESSRIKRPISDHVMKLETARRGTLADKAATAAKENKIDDGTDLALRKVAKKFGIELRGFLWGQMAQTIESNSGEDFGVKMWSKSLWPEYVKSGAGDNLDEIEEAIYEDLKRAKIKELKYGK